MHIHAKVCGSMSNRFGATAKQLNVKCLILTWKSMISKIWLKFYCLISLVEIQMNAKNGICSFSRVFRGIVTRKGSGDADMRRNAAWLSFRSFRSFRNRIANDLYHSPLEWANVKRRYAHVKPIQDFLSDRKRSVCYTCYRWRVASVVFAIPVTVDE